jgi:hypothetical protein
VPQTPFALHKGVDPEHGPQVLPAVPQDVSL